MPFKKGQSGNPTGLKPGRKQAFLREIMSGDDVQNAIQTIRDCLKDDNYKLAAAKEILDRVYGKALQASDVNVSGELAQTISVIINGKPL